MNDNIKGYIYIALVTLIWGSAYPIVKILENYISPIYVAFLRSFIGGLIILILWKKIIYGVKETIAGLLNMGLFLIFLNLGIMYSKNPSLAAVLVYTQPIFVVILSRFYLKLSITYFQYIGIIIGFIGIFLTSLSSISFSLGLIFSLISGLSWALGTVYFVKNLSNKDVIALNSYMSLISAPFILAFIPISYYFVFNLKSLLLIIYTTVIIQALAWLLWFYAVKLVGPVKSSSIVMLTPVVSFLFTIYLIKILPTFLQVIGSSMALIGSLISQIGYRRK
ncbi:DMT family transporter [Caldisphaera sp.]|uniref:DMT family transporter n=1 Tax=Caldisphaera sp. TaxID=2060322 RepID=UPI0025B97516|nr:DMT family transporter [Caldisphaera sp.]